MKNHHSEDGVRPQKACRECGTLMDPRSLERHYVRFHLARGRHACTVCRLAHDPWVEGQDECPVGYPHPTPQPYLTSILPPIHTIHPHKTRYHIFVPQ